MNKNFFQITSVAAQIRTDLSKLRLSPVLRVFSSVSTASLTNGTIPVYSPENIIFDELGNSKFFLPCVMGSPFNTPQSLYLESTFSYVFSKVLHSLNEGVYNLNFYAYGEYSDIRIADTYDFDFLSGSLTKNAGIDYSGFTYIPVSRMYYEKFEFIQEVDCHCMSEDVAINIIESGIMNMETYPMIFDLDKQILVSIDLITDPLSQELARLKINSSSK